MITSLSTAPAPNFLDSERQPPPPPPQQLSRVGLAPLSTNHASPHLPSFQGLLISISNRSLLIFLQNVFHFTDITAATTSGSLAENPQVGLKAPQ